MKIFAVYSKIELIEKPDWLEVFYKKYNTSTNYHVTLKQSCYLEEKEIPNVKANLSALFSSIPIPKHEIILTLNQLVLDENKNEQKTIMINAEYHADMHYLQKEILSALNKYRDYVYPESRAWEENFKPHITLASDITPNKYREATKELRQPYGCKGRIQDVSLIIVEKMIPQEADRSENQTIYSL